MYTNLKGKKILLLYTAHTSGHMRIAQNIGYWLQRAGGVVVLQEVLKSNPSPLVKKFLRLHVWVNVHVPELWNFLYRYGFWIFMMPWRLLVAQLQKTEIEKCVKTEMPDLVVTTQTAPSAVMSVLKRSGAFGGVWGIAFSDYHFHRAWAYPRADFYLTNIPEQAAHLRALGVSPEKIFRVGFALPPLPKVDTSLVREKIGVALTDKIILVGSGSLGVRVPQNLFAGLEQVVRLLAAEGVACKVVVACGRNAELYESLQARVSAGQQWLVPLSYYEPMEEIYAISSVFITKPGGLSVAEALLFGVPLCITHTLPGQEDINLVYLEEHGLVKNLTHSDTATTVQYIKDMVRSEVQPVGSARVLVAPDIEQTLSEFLSAYLDRK